MIGITVGSVTVIEMDELEGLMFDTVSDELPDEPLESLMKS